MRATRTPHRRAFGRVAHGSHLAVMLALTAGVFAPPRASAQDRRAERQSPLTLAQVVAEARRANPRIAASRASVTAARAQIPIAGALPDPQVQFGLMNYGLRDFRPMDPLGMTQVQVMQMVPVAGQLGLAERIAATRANAVSSRSSDVEWDIRFRAAAAFYDLYATDAKIAVATETLRLLKDIASIARAMYEVGEGRQADVLRAEVEIARMHEDILTMRAMRTAAAGKLNALLDRPYDDPVGTPSLPLFTAAPPSLDSLVTLALLDRPMLRAAEADLVAAEQRVILTQREIWPDLQIGLSYGTRGGDMGREHMASLMVGASLPIFAGRRQYRMRDEAEAMRAMNAADLAAMRADTRGLVTAAHAELTRARALSSLCRTTIIPQAEATVQSALAAYRVGRVDFMTLLDSRMAVNEYRQRLVTLEAEEGMAWAELEMLAGRELLDTHTTDRTGDAGGTR